MRLISLVLALSLGGPLAYAKPAFQRAGKASKAPKAEPGTVCIWGPAQAAGDAAAWQELRCGADPKPYGIGNKDLTVVSISRPVAYVDEINGSSVTISVQTSAAEYFVDVPMSHVPKGAKAETWFVIDPSAVKLLKKLDKAGALDKIAAE